jgi:hypothetical protein
MEPKDYGMQPCININNNHQPRLLIKHHSRLYYAQLLDTRSDSILFFTGKAEGWREDGIDAVNIFDVLTGMGIPSLDENALSKMHIYIHT